MCVPVQGRGLRRPAETNIPAACESGFGTSCSSNALIYPFFLFQRMRPALACAAAAAAAAVQCCSGFSLSHNAGFPTAAGQRERACSFSSSTSATQGTRRL